MFRRTNRAQPLKVQATVKYIKEGENVDVANAILSVENSSVKTPKVNRKRASTMSSQRRSQSIERIFKKEKKDELKQQLEDLRHKEKLLIIQNAPLPPPPPPPPAKLFVKKPCANKVIGNVRPEGPEKLKISQEDIIAIKTGLKKVEKEKEQKSEEKKENGLFNEIQSKLTLMRSRVALSESDESDGESESSEEF
ncbi:hypothetical protein TVAG_043000 [Trichomonas vaginalis G3]|uniref:Uncharacterized protein n=1 Tax=Trichomonas vaginalis (strain ATCC PRA-98 / G3) TaxID=412133 RepID=A2F6R4_TRIV3|nr:hypothetical protein TVAGG3_0701600 [Trichomonas vaginalis G3]EAX99392.1 hypothetical protein TVAG_043000 [Trichomonas vaginalis G3]KAI5509280.1 hypothetical protein TVAGG3_0701600 [Trichomonas vaginalis G3]|eukprot:XP_001312322.1 hypothetical protein [Trichomonas vaginalis G3]